MKRIIFILLFALFLIPSIQNVSLAGPRGIIRTFITVIERINSSHDEDGRVSAIREALESVTQHGSRQLIEILENEENLIKEYLPEGATDHAIDHVRATVAYLLSEIRTFEEPGVIKYHLVKIFSDEGSHPRLRESVGAALSSLYGVDFFESEEFKSTLGGMYGEVKEDTALAIVRRFIKPELFLLINMGSLNEDIAYRAALEFEERSRGANLGDLITAELLPDLLRGVRLFESYQARSGFRRVGSRINLITRLSLENYVDIIIRNIIYSQEISFEKKSFGIFLTAMVQEERAIPVLNWLLENSGDLKEERIIIDNAYGVIASRVLKRVVTEPDLPEENRAALMFQLAQTIRISSFVAYEFSKLVRSNDIYQHLLESLEYASIVLSNNRDHFADILSSREVTPLYRAYAAVALSSTGFYNEATVKATAELLEVQDGNVREVANESLELLYEPTRRQLKDSYWTKRKIEAAHLLSLIPSERALLILLEESVLYAESNSRYGNGIREALSSFVQNYKDREGLQIILERVVSNTSVAASIKESAKSILRAQRGETREINLFTAPIPGINSERETNSGNKSSFRKLLESISSAGRKSRSRR